MSFGRLGAMGRGFGGLGGLLGSAGGSPASTYTLAAEAGSFVFSGDNMTPLVDYRIPVDVGAFAEIGQDASLKRGYLTSAAVGAFTLTGQDATLTAAASFSLTNTDSAVDNTNATTITFTGKSFGAAAANRRIIIVFFGRTGNTALTSVTVGGVNASAVSGAAGINTNTTLSNIYITDSDPSGTSGNVVIVGPAAILRCGIGVYRLITSTPTASASGNQASVSASSRSTTITVPTGGAGLNIYGSRDTAGAPTWTNAGTAGAGDFSLNMTGGGNVSGAITIGTGSITVTGAASTNECALSSAAWGP
jgi:hypothetical protein